jgi:MFS family permease
LDVSIQHRLAPVRSHDRCYRAAAAQRAIENVDGAGWWLAAACCSRHNPSRSHDHEECPAVRHNLCGLCEGTQRPRPAVGRGRSILFDAIPVTNELDPRLATASGAAARDTRAGPVQSVSLLFVVTYVAAYTGTWLALATPVVVTIALKVTQLTGVKGAPAALSLVLGVGALLSIFANPFFGKLSDRTRSQLGMRRPWMVGGLVGGAVSLLVIALAPTVPLVLLGWCLAQLSFNALVAALVAVLADKVPEHQRGTVAGALGIALPVALVVGTFLVQAVAGSNLAMFMVPTVLGGGLVLLFVLFVLKDRRLDRSEQLPPYGLGEFLGSFWINPFQFPDFGWAWISRFIVVMGYATVSTYQAFFLLNKLHISASAVPRAVFYGTLANSATLLVFSVLGGRFSDALGRRKVFVFSASVIYAIAVWVIAIATHVNGYLAGMAIGGLAFGVYLAVDLALVTDVLPNRETDAARGLGVFNIANAAPYSLAPAIAPVFLAIGAALAVPGGPYTALFTAAGLFAVVGALTIIPVRGVR